MTVSTFKEEKYVKKSFNKYLDQIWRELMQDHFIRSKELKCFFDKQEESKDDVLILALRCVQRA